MDLIKQQPQELAAKLSVNDMAISDIDSQIKSLQAKKKKLTKEVDDFKSELREQMAEHGVTRIESEDHDIMIRLDPPSKQVSIDDEESIPEKFFRVKKEVDKVAIKKAIECGDFVDGASIKEGKHRLVIKL